ncbi:MAG: hypothetical protein ACRD0U_16465 [Acidimicrobiales bacterium]
MTLVLILLAGSIGAIYYFLAIRRDVIDAVRAGPPSPRPQDVYDGGWAEEPRHGQRRRR